jgi:hypothetical protein
MKRSRLVLLVVAIAVLILLILPTSIASANFPIGHVYANDWPGWSRAVGTWGLETFADSYLNPNLSVVSDVGFVADEPGPWDWGYWSDSLTPGRATTWCFSHPIKAWGGFWCPWIPCGPESGLEVWIGNLGGNGLSFWLHVGTIPSDYSFTFWGFTCSLPFNAVRVTTSGQETYWLDDMYWSTTVYYPGFIGKGGMRPGCFGPPTTLPPA